MFTILLCVGLIAISCAVGAWIYIKPAPRSKVSYAIVALVALSVGGIGPLSYKIAHHAAQRGAIGGYHQFLNGSIVAANVDTTDCHRDGSCVRTYTCDPYTDSHVETYTDADGKMRTRIVTETKYHDCPYATKEYTYILTDSLGKKHTIANHIFSDHPKEWRNGEGIPSGVKRGVPKVWQAAKDAITIGDLYPVTLPSTYDNYILADQQTILRESSDYIDKLKKLKLLPDHTRNLRDPIYDNFSADKVSFVGVQPADAAAWQKTLMYFNAALGMKRQGDMHVVALKASLLPPGITKDKYATALKAYWLNKLGKYALPKNSIMLVLGVDDSASTVLWSQAYTGMPVGNGSMLSALSHLDGTPFTTDALFGSTRAQLDTSSGKLKARYTIGTGKVAGVVMNEFPFARACMKCNDKNEANQQGFTYLSTDLPTPTSYIVWTIIIDVLIMLIFWAVLVWINSNLSETSTPSRSRFTNRSRYLVRSWPFR